MYIYDIHHNLSNNDNTNYMIVMHVCVVCVSRRLAEQATLLEAHQRYLYSIKLQHKEEVLPGTKLAHRTRKKRKGVMKNATDEVHFSIRHLLLASQIAPSGTNIQF
jgi:hypothetical protein